MTDVKVIGLAELQKAMDTLPEKIERNVLMSGLAAGAKVIRDRARELAPERTGALRKSIRTSRQARKNAVAIKAGKRGKAGQAWYAAIVHKGATPHVVLPRREGGMLFFNGRFMRAIHHPGFAGVPFLGAAVEQMADAAVRAMAQKIAERLRTQHGLDVPAPETFDETE